jgi:hypothetical protein
MIGIGFVIPIRDWAKPCEIEAIGIAEPLELLALLIQWMILLLGATYESGTV